MERHKDTYIVIKTKDAEAYLSDGLKADLDRVCDAVAERREADGRHPMECVVVEKDWPEYEHVWRMIEARVDSRGAPESIAAHAAWQIEEQDINTGDSEWYHLDTLPVLINFWRKFETLPDKTYSLHEFDPEKDEWNYVGELQK